MTKKNDGGPAFPLRAPTGGGWNQTGMTLRDFFAANALASGMDLPVVPVTDAHIVAAHCYAIADAMLAEREKQ